MLPLFYIAPQGPIVVSESDLFGVKLTIEINLLWIDTNPYSEFYNDKMFAQVRFAFENLHIHNFAQMTGKITRAPFATLWISACMPSLTWPCYGVLLFTASCYVLHFQQ